MKKFNFILAVIAASFSANALADGIYDEIRDAKAKQWYAQEALAAIGETTELTRTVCFKNNGIFVESGVVKEANANQLIDTCEEVQTLKLSKDELEKIDDAKMKRLKYSTKIYCFDLRDGEIVTEEYKKYLPNSRIICRSVSVRDRNLF